MEVNMSAARVVVAIDFGTTFSGFAYARRMEPHKIFKCYEWPYADKAGAKPYCKTQTSLYYEPLPDGGLNLKNWGWPAFVSFTQATRSQPKSSNSSSELIAYGSRLWESSDLQGTHYGPTFVNPFTESSNFGFFATKFKLYLASVASPGHSNNQPELPCGLTSETLIVDYLRCLSHFILSELQLRYGQHFGKDDIQWCLTVPAIWDERAKQTMKIYAEKAGMVKGVSCSPASSDASPHPLDIILEPEAASVYCQYKAKAIMNLRQGDKILVADIGGGTLDLVLHEKADDDPESMNVNEVVGSYGELGGGTFVDLHFFNFLSRKIGCFKEFCNNNPSIGINIYGWWQSIKIGFDGDGYSAEMPLPRKLSQAWEKYDEKTYGSSKHDEDYYDEIRLDDCDLKSIFDPEVEKVMMLIDRQIRGVRVLMVVGGFSASPYLRKKIRNMFSRRVEEIIVPEDPGSAICHGAVQLHIHNDIIQSRIAKKTYGLSCNRPAKVGDPNELLYVNDDGELECRNSLSVFVRAGEKVPLNKSITKTFFPSKHQQRTLAIELWSNPNPFSQFATVGAGSMKEGSFVMDISEDMELDKKREISETLCFGASLIHVTAKPLNFGGSYADHEQGISVTFCT